MRGKHGNHAKASRQHRWKPGSRVGSTGYVKVRVGKGHPLADPNGWAYEHVVVWCAAGNTRPMRGEILHHINEDKTDNRLENLALMTAPIRLQLSRAKGFNLQAHSRAINGLEAVKVARPSVFGNRWKIGTWSNYLGRACLSNGDAALCFREVGPATWPHFMEFIQEQLRGKNLACWCKPGEPCHADVLLEIANRPVCEAVG